LGGNGSKRIKRKPDLAYLLRLIGAGESCSIVAVSGVGKSNLLRQLMDPAIREYLVGYSMPEYRTIMLDGNALPLTLEQGVAERAKVVGEQVVDGHVWQSIEHAFYDAVLGQVASQHGVSDSIQQQIRRHAACLSLYAPHELFESVVVPAMQLFFSEPELHLAIIIDHFDEPFKLWPSRLLVSLRALRDRFKYRLCWVVATRKELTVLREHLAEYEEFHELVAPNVLWLKPFEPGDAAIALNELIERRGWDIPEDIKHRLIEITGGHFGLLRSSAIVWAEGRVNKKGNEVSIGDLLSHPNIKRECQKIWESVTQAELNALAALALRPTTNIDPQLLDRLLLKGLALLDNGRIRLFCQLFRDFTRTLSPPFTVDEATHSVTIEGVLYQLTNLEFRLFRFMMGRSAHTCTRDEIIENVYGEKFQGDIDNSRVDALVERLRRKIELDPSDPHLIVTVRGLGYTLRVDSLESRGKTGSD